MIESLHGKLLQKHATHALIECSGVGFGLHISLPTYESLGEAGETVMLLTYLHVREDTLQLYGFQKDEERQMFLLLLGVSGIGPKIAMGILSAISVAELCELVRKGDVARLRHVPGIGPKTAERLMVELRNRVDKISIAPQASSAPAQSKNFNEALLALQSLGYKQADAVAALNRTSGELPQNAAVEELIKQALKSLM